MTSLEWSTQNDYIGAFCLPAKSIKPVSKNMYILGDMCSKCKSYEEVTKLGKERTKLETDYKQIHKSSYNFMAAVETIQDRIRIGISRL